MLESLSQQIHGASVSLPPKFQPKKPHFFRIIHPTLLKDGKPELPKRFLKEYGEHLSSTAFLKVPKGLQWRVELMKSHGETRFQGGWQEFCDFYSIGYGHFLLFRYEGDSHFHVVIFDMTATEIEYPSTINPTRDDVSVKILVDSPAKQTTQNETSCLPKMKKTASEHNFNDCPPSNNTSKKRKLGFLQPSDKPFNPSNLHQKGIQGTGMKFTKLETEVDFFSPTPEIFRHDKKIVREKAATQGGTVAPATAAGEKQGAFQRAESLKPTNPFFIITMQPSYIATTRKGMNIPMGFVKTHFTMDNDKAILLSNRRSWKIRYRVNRKDVKFTSDWGKFASDNGLQLGDVCVFELIKPSANMLKVVIFRK